MSAFLWIWAWCATFAAAMMCLRAQRWINRWYEQGEELARALDREAGLREFLSREPLRKHTRDDGSALYRSGVEVPDLQAQSSQRVVPPGGPFIYGRATEEQPVPGLQKAGGLGAPGAAQESRRDEARPGPGLTVVGTSDGQVHHLRVPPGPDELPY